MTAYALDCPSCGQQLQPHAGDPHSAPWLCNVCRHAFLQCELQPGTRAHYRANLHDFGFGPHLKQLQIDRAIELAEAHKRGTSARHDQLAILSAEQLQSVASRPKLEPTFKVKVEEAIAAKGVK